MKNNKRNEGLRKTKLYKQMMNDISSMVNDLNDLEIIKHTSYYDGFKGQIFGLVYYDIKNKLKKIE